MKRMCNVICARCMQWELGAKYYLPTQPFVVGKQQEGVAEVLENTTPYAP